MNSFSFHQKLLLAMRAFTFHNAFKQNNSLMINNLTQLFISYCQSISDKLYRECLITFGCPRVFDIVPFGRPDGTSPPGFVPPRLPYTLGRRPQSDQSYGQPHFLYFKWPRVTGSPISSTLNGQTDNIFSMESQ